MDNGIKPEFSTRMPAFCSLAMPPNRSMIALTLFMAGLLRNLFPRFPRDEFPLGLG
jgi:hypothetical protein